MMIWGFLMQSNIRLFFSIIYDEVPTYNSETQSIAWSKKSGKKSQNDISNL